MLLASLKSFRRHYENFSTTQFLHGSFGPAVGESRCILHRKRNHENYDVTTNKLYLIYRPIYNPFNLDAFNSSEVW